MSKCVSCGNDLGKARRKYVWFLQQGYDPKDASALILRDPDSKLPARQCCITALQTNIKLQDTEEYVEKIKERIAEKMRLTGEIPKQRELYTLYPITSQGIGEFILRDSPFDDPEILSTNFNEEGRIGYKISNITKVPRSLLEKEGWTNENSVMLWFAGQIKLLVLENKRVEGSDGTTQDVGMIKWKNNQTGAEGILDYNDVSFVGAKILGYTSQVYTIPYHGNGTVQIQVMALTVEKLAPSENIYL